MHDRVRRFEAVGTHTPAARVARVLALFAATGGAALVERATARPIAQLGDAYQAFLEGPALFEVAVGGPLVHTGRVAVAAVGSDHLLVVAIPDGMFNTVVAQRVGNAAALLARYAFPASPPGFLPPAPVAPAGGAPPSAVASVWKRH